MAELGPLLDAGVNLVVERDFWGPPARRMAAASFALCDAWLGGLTWEPSG